MSNWADLCVVVFFLGVFFFWNVRSTLGFFVTTNNREKLSLDEFYFAVVSWYGCIDRHRRARCGGSGRM